MKILWQLTIFSFLTLPATYCLANEEIQPTENLESREATKPAPHLIKLQPRGEKLPITVAVDEEIPVTSSLPHDVPPSDAPPSSPKQPFLPEEVNSAPLPPVVDAPPDSEIQYSAEEPVRLPSEYMEYRDTIQDYAPRHCPPCWGDGSYGEYWDGNHGAHCTCQRRKLKWWQKAAPWNWGREDEHDPRCECFIKASLRAMDRMHPPGLLLSSSMGVQVANGNAAQLMLHHVDFVPNSAELTVRGQRELRRMASILPHSPYLIKIEATPYRDSLGIVRQAAVMKELSLMFPGTNLHERVIISEPYTRGLDGVDAVPISAGLLQLQLGGGAAGGGGPAGGAAGAGAGFAPTAQ